MKEQRGVNTIQRLARIGLVGFALGAGYQIVRLQKKSQVRRWRAHLTRVTTRTALVTGASAGIGRAYALRLAADGYALVLVARRIERLETLAELCRSRYAVAVEVLPADLSTEAGIARVEQRIQAGGIDFLVNNAGYDVFGDFAQTPVEKYLGLLQCLELATVQLTRAALPAMLANRRGAVVNVSSIGAFTPKRKDSIYVGAKAFINLFTESLALELNASGVRVQSLCPGFTLTEFHDAPEYEQYHIKERIPAWLWMSPEKVVEDSLRALGENQVVCVPGLINQVIVFAARSGLSQMLMGIMTSFFHGLDGGEGAAATMPQDWCEHLACPACHGELALREAPQPAVLLCAGCQKEYPILDGIPRFIQYEDLNGFNRRFAGLYDWFSIIYRLFSKVAFAFIGTTEDEARFEILDRLQPRGSVLEVSIGPGVNLPYLREYPQVSEIHGLDISNGQLAHCQGYARSKGWPVALYQGNAEALPFQDNAFDSVFHIGGINFFNDKAKAIEEMIRVAKPGAKILISDETERGARGYEVTLPGFKQSFNEPREVVRPPVDLVPPQMEDVNLDETIWKGWFYCLEFRKPAG